jgi:glucosamine--fructose-6-phosphate aminotransferase (isomerizing)
LSEVNRDVTAEALRPGAHSLAEILSQPACWADCLKLLDQSPVSKAALELCSSATEMIFVGCGSSYYAALSAAAGWSAITGMRARAVPASEIILQPALTLTGSHNFLPVLISRSGRTSEVLKAGEYLKGRGISCLAITCAPGQALEKIASVTVCLAPADEQSTVMTRSFTSMLLAILYLAARFVKNDAIKADLSRMVNPAATFLNSLPQRLKQFVDAHSFDDYVCLGQGPFFGIACESILKLTEMSVSYGQSFHTLEFRHGPKSIVGPRTLVLFLISEASSQAECEVLEEVKKLGGKTLVVANTAGAARKHADLLLETELEVPEIARLGPYLFCGQLMGLYTGLKKSLNPDQPRHLSRVVLLDRKDSDETAEHAAL